MKKTVRVVGLIVVIALALLMLTGCSDTPTVSGTKADVQAQIAVANSLTGNQPTPTDISYSLERYNLIRRLTGLMVSAKRQTRSCARLKNRWAISCSLPETLLSAISS